MQSKRLLFWLVTILTFFAIIIDFPKVPISISRPFEYKRLWRGLDLDWDFREAKSDHPFLLGWWLPDEIKHKSDLKLGLDLQGGMKIVLKGDMAQIPEDQRMKKIEATKAIIQGRIDEFGVSEPDIRTAKSGEEYRIIVELPGSGADVESQIDTIKKVAKLEFWEAKSQEELQALDPSSLESIQTEEGVDPFISYMYRRTDVTGADLEDAYAKQDPQSGQGFAVFLKFSDEGAGKFSELAARNRGQNVAIVLDGNLLSSPTISADFGLQPGADTSTVLITGEFSREEANNLAIQLRGGALPIPVEVIEQRTIEATLGQEQLNKSAFAGAVGIILVMVFMVYLYKVPGLLADVALVIYTLLTISIFKIFPITLTLAGIAGLILSIGVAVDANVLIFERMLEEIRQGKDKVHALKLGFERAWPSIRDSNFSTLITCTILYVFGSGMVRGFAITLAVGVMVSLFTAITVTRMLLDRFYTGRN